MNYFRNWIPGSGSVLKVIFLILGVAGISIATYLISNVNLLPPEGTDEARAVDALFRFELIVASIITLSIAAILLYCMLAFRRRPGDFSDGPPIEGSVILELIWTVIPVVLVAFLSIYSFSVYRQLARTNPIEVGHYHPPLRSDTAQAQGRPPVSAPNPDSTRNGLPPIEVQVTAQQYAWIFKYAASGIEVAELHLPAGREIRLNMSSPDVIHAFWVPEFRLQQYIIPGRTTQLRLLPRRKGEYVLECNMLCGPYHGAMRATVYVEEPAAFDRWVKEQKALLSAQPPLMKALPSIPKPLRSVQTAALIDHLNPLRGQ